MTSLERTPLFQCHQELGAKLVPFGGWEMPIQYTSILEEHEATRTHVGLFDVSHMGEIEIKGKDALPFVQKMVTQDVSASEAGVQVQYSLMCTETGGVIDDILIYKHSDEHFFLCVNASNIEKDFEWLKKHHTSEKITIENRSQDYVQIAIQGPKAFPLLQSLTDIDLSKIEYYRYTQDLFLEIPMIISRTGYTGEDGFELYLPSEKGPMAWRHLLHKGKPFGIRPCGLGARDTLRIEMRYPLYGHELSESISPLEAQLAWVVKLKKNNFIGKEALLKQKEKGLTRKLVGFEMIDPGIPRQDYPLLSSQNELIGKVTSGTLSPTLKKGIGIGFVPLDFSTIGTEILVSIRNKGVRAKIVQTPFIRNRKTH